MRFQYSPKHWLLSSLTDQPGEQTNNFNFLNELEQLVQHFTRTSDRFGDSPKTLDPFQTSNPNTYSIRVAGD